MGRSPCCSKKGLNRGAWTAIEDKILSEYIKVHGEGKWRNLPKRAGLKRCGKSCRLRWLNYLRPDIKRGNITHDEEELIIRLHNLLGNRWSLIAGRLPGRTDNEIKNYWNTNIGKRFQSSPHNRNQYHDNASPKTTCRTRPPKPSHYDSKSSPEQHGQDQPSSPQCSRVVRTRATRCTKVVLFPQPVPHAKPTDDVIRRPKPKADNDHTLLITTARSTAIDGREQISVDGGPFPVPILDGCDQISNFNDLMIGDDNFFSDFLNVDFFGEMVNDQAFDDVMFGSCNKLGDVTDHHREGLLFSQDMLSSMINPQLDWLQFEDEI